MSSLNVVIIGCSSGIGKSLVETYCKYQFTNELPNNLLAESFTGQKLNLFLVDKDGKGLEILKDKLTRGISEKDRKVGILEQDISDFTNATCKPGNAAYNIIIKSQNFFNNQKIDHLICNAAILVKASPKDVNLNKNKELWEKIYKTNFLGLKRIVDYALKEDRIVKGSGVIAITNSIEGIRYLPTPNNYFGCYCKTKKLLDKWVNSELRKKCGKDFNVLCVYPSKVENPMFFLNSFDKNGNKTEKKPEWEILGLLAEPYKPFDEIKLEDIALKYYVAIFDNSEKIFSSKTDEFIMKLPEPLCVWIFYFWGLFKNLTMFDLPFFLIQQLPFMLPIFFQFLIHSNYTFENVITKKDIESSEYELDYINYNYSDDEYVCYIYYIINIILIVLLLRWLNKHLSILKKINNITTNIKKAISNI